MAWDTADVAALLETLGFSASPGDAPDLLDVALSGDDPDHPHATRVWLAATHVEQRLLRFDVVYPFSAERLDEARLAGGLLLPHLLLGRTEVDDDGTVHHRYTMLVDVDTPFPAAVLTHVVSILDYEQLHFGDYLESLCVKGSRIDTFVDLVAAGEASDLD